LSSTGRLVTATTGTRFSTVLPAPRPAHLGHERGQVRDPNPPAAARLAVSCLPDRRAQIPASAAVAGGVHDRKACDETPSRAAARPLIITWPPSTASTVRTLVNPPMAFTCAGLMPEGSTANRSGTKAGAAANRVPNGLASRHPVAPGATRASGRLAWA
jgi:hypothetical protein